MKKFTLLFLFFSLAVSAQVFPEYDLSYLKPGMKVKTADGLENLGFKRFYEDTKAYNKYKTEELKTPYDLLKDRIFEIIEVRFIDDPDLGKHYIIDLKDTVNQEIIYFKQPIGSQTVDEILMVDNLELPAEYFCNYVKQMYGSDSFYIDDEIEIIKSKTNNKIFYSLSLKTLPIQKNSGKGTLTITLKNGKTILRKNVIAKATPSFDGTLESYKIDLTLTAAEMELLKESEMVSYDFFSLYTYKVPQQTAGVTKGAVACLIKK